jgi:hypothetical protein
VLISVLRLKPDACLRVLSVMLQRRRKRRNLPLRLLGHLHLSVRRVGHCSVRWHLDHLRIAISFLTVHLADILGAVDP